MGEIRYGAIDVKLVLHGTVRKMMLCKKKKESKKKGNRGGERPFLYAFKSKGLVTFEEV